MKLYAELGWMPRIPFTNFLQLFLELNSVNPGCYEYENHISKGTLLYICLPNDENLMNMMCQSSPDGHISIVNSYLKKRAEKLYELLVGYVKVHYRKFLASNNICNEAAYEKIKIWHPEFPLDSVPSPKIRQSDIFAIHLARMD